MWEESECCESEYRLERCVVRGERLSSSVCACTAYVMCDGCDKIS